MCGRTHRWLVVAAAVTVGCSGGAAQAPTSDGATATDGAASNGTTWSDGTRFSAAVEIAAGTTVTIAPGAHVTMAGKFPITVRGTLEVASAAGTHARLAPADAMGKWTGLVVENGGTLAADGLDLDGAETA